MVSPAICPVESLLRVPAGYFCTDHVAIDNLDPCLQKYVLMHDELKQGPAARNPQQVQGHIWGNEKEQDAQCKKDPCDPFLGNHS